MRCCNKAKQVGRKAVNIAKGYTALAIGKKYDFTDDRVRVCQKCKRGYWIGRALFCSLCKCFVPAKARAQGEKCPLGKWDNRVKQ